MERRIIETGDGSKTIYIPEMDENYHSSHGAYNEAVHIFINNGLEFMQQNSLRIFEMGFGTGLNAILTLQKGIDLNKRIEYLGIEAFPVNLDLINELNYQEYLLSENQAFFKQMHLLDWGVSHEIHSNFTFHKIHKKIEDFIPETESIDLIYFDAFGPRAQSEMWEKSILEKMFKMLRSGGVLVTYCAKGQFKRDLKSLGFEVENLPGPPGKREMTRAFKPS